MQEHTSMVELAPSFDFFFNAANAAVHAQALPDTVTRDALLVGNALLKRLKALQETLTEQDIVDPLDRNSSDLSTLDQPPCLWSCPTFLPLCNSRPLLISTSPPASIATLPGVLIAMAPEPVLR